MGTPKTMENKMIIVAVRPPKCSWERHLIRSEELESFKEKWEKQGYIWRFPSYPA